MLLGSVQREDRSVVAKAMVPFSPSQRILRLESFHVRHRARRVELTRTAEGRCPGGAPWAYRTPVRRRSGQPLSAALCSSEEGVLLVQPSLEGRKPVTSRSRTGGTYTWRWRVKAGLLFERWW